jgi:hypothetical protein
VGFLGPLLRVAATAILLGLRTSGLSRSADGRTALFPLRAAAGPVARERSNAMTDATIDRDQTSGETRTSGVANWALDAAAGTAAGSILDYFVRRLVVPLIMLLEWHPPTSAALSRSDEEERHRSFDYVQHLTSPSGNCRGRRTWRYLFPPASSINDQENVIRDDALSIDRPE